MNNQPRSSMKLITCGHCGGRTIPVCLIQFSLYEGEVFTKITVAFHPSILPTSPLLAYICICIYLCVCVYMCVHYMRILYDYPRILDGKLEGVFIERGLRFLFVSSLLKRFDNLGGLDMIRETVSSLRL